MTTNNDNVFNFIDEALVENPEDNIVIPNSAKKSFRMEKKPNDQQSQPKKINIKPKKTINVQKTQHNNSNANATNTSVNANHINNTIQSQNTITVPNDVIKDVNGYMDSNGFDHNNIGSGDMFAVIAPDKEPLKPDYDPDVVSREDVLTFDYFPDISLDKVSVENIQHTEETAKAARERQEQLAKEQTEEELEKQRLSIGFVLSIIGLFVFFLTIPAIIISKSEMKKGRKKAKAGFVIGIIGLVLFIIEAAAIVFFIIKFGQFI